MGGLPQNGVIHHGTHEDIRKAVFDILDIMGDDHFILGSDCVLPTDILYQRLVWAVEACEEYCRNTQKITYLIIYIKMRLCKAVQHMLGGLFSVVFFLYRFPQ